MSEGLPFKPLQPARPLSQVHLPPGSAEEAIASVRAFGTSFPQAAGSQAAQTSTTLQLPTVPVTEQSQQPQTGAPPAKKARRRQPTKAQEQVSTSQLSIPQGPQQVQHPQTEAPSSKKAKQPSKSLKRSIDSVEPSTSQEGPPTKKPALQASQPAQPQIHAPPSTISLPAHQPAQPLQIQAPRSDPVPGAWWEIPGFSEAFKQFHRDRYGKDGSLKACVIKGLVDLAIREHKRIHAAAAAQQAADNQGVANPAALEQDTAPVAAGLQALEDLPGGPSSEMGAENQQTAIDPPIDPQLQEQYDASSMDPRAHAMLVGGVKLSQVGLGPDPALPKDDVDGRFKMIQAELKNQAFKIPIPPVSALPRQPPKEFVGSTYQMPPGVQDLRLEEVLRRRNEIILNRQKQVDLGRNNLAAKGTRERREEKEKNLKKIISRLQVEMNWWRLKAVSLGGNAREWDAIPDPLKNKMLQDMDGKVCQAEKAQSVDIKKIKGLEHSARNTGNARLSKQDIAKKENEVQAIIAAIEAKDREIQEAQSQGLEPPEMNLDEFVEMTFPDDVIHVDTTTAPGATTGDAVEAPTPIDDNLNDSIHANTSGYININGVPIETSANIGENAGAGGAIGYANTTDVNSATDVGNPININGSMALNNTMDGNALNTDNMVSALAMNNGSLPPNNWAYQPYAQIDNTPAMSMDFQGAPLNNYDIQDSGMQDSGMQNNWVPDGTVMDNGLQSDAFDDFDPQSTDFLNLGSQDNGFMQNSPQDTLFATNDMQNTNITTNGFQRITSLDNCTQGSTSLDFSIEDDAPFDTSLFSNASIDNGTQNNASSDINFQDNTSTMPLSALILRAMATPRTSRSPIESPRPVSLAGPARATAVRSRSPRTLEVRSLEPISLELRTPPQTTSSTQPFSHALDLTTSITETLTPLADDLLVPANRSSLLGLAISQTTNT
ncbi:Glucan endo-1,3-beta-glucosidase [Fusarium oxysporum f. sp. albedinis]|nr:Glucan endo-1,3-beta-glucosidase [Fusarium oxysporum f. sp. albedinis]